MAKRKRSDTSQQAAAVVPPVPAQALQGAPAAALQELAMLQSQAAMLSAQLQEVSARALATMQACSQLAATVAGQPAPGAAHDAPAAETANGPRQTSTMPTLMAGFPTLFQQAQQLTTPAWPASAALPPATSSEIQEALQSTSRRREKDKEKKRKRRDMSGSLVKQLQDMVPGDNLSLNSTLQRTIEAVKAQLSKGYESVATIEPGHVPPNILRAGMRAYRRVGIAIVNSDMRVIDTNAAMETALNPHGEAGQAGVSGQPIWKYIHPRDGLQLRSAASHVAQAKLKDEALRRYVVGVRVRSPTDASEWECRAVEVVACGSNAFGHLFMLFLYQPDPSKSASKVLAALGSFGESFAAAGDDFVSFEFADEMDAKGMHQVLREDPTAYDILMELASADRQTLDGFAEQLNHLDAGSSKVFKVFAQFLARVVEAEKVKAEQKKQQGLEVSSARLEHCVKALHSMCSAGRFNLLSSPDTIKMQWSLAGLSVAETVATKANENEVVCVAPGVGVRPPLHSRNKLKVTLLDTGDIWFHHMEVPNSSELRGSRSRYLNVMISRLPCGGLHLRRYPMLDGQTFSQSRVFKKAAAEGPIFSDYRSTKHVMNMFFDWCQRGNRPVHPPRITIADASTPPPLSSLFKSFLFLPQSVPALDDGCECVTRTCVCVCVCVLEQEEEDAGEKELALGLPYAFGRRPSSDIFISREASPTFRFSPSPVPRFLFASETEDRETDSSIAFSPFATSSPSSPSPFPSTPLLERDAGSV